MTRPQEEQATDRYSTLSALLKAAGDPLRLEVLRVLSQGSYGVLELCRIFDMRQPALSHHLKVLANAELVTRRREGNSLFYRRQAGGPLQQQLFAEIDALPIKPEHLPGLEAVASEREQASRRFFADYSNRFREQQELIADYGVYGPQVAELLQPGQCALEVGPGEGQFLAELAPRFEKVVALDLAEAMLERSRAFADKHGLGNIEFVLGDTSEVATRKLLADVVVVNMVLHHTPDPALILSDLAGALNPGGQLLVTELQQHQQDWARDACGDLWLGFEPEQLQQYATSAGLQPGRSIYSALRNGFQIQIREFLKAD
ncbi:metalloregulator ArsR/SmtB family transcription factor [Biformimicrobium ophioploci]|uniref:Metalloregulator ArsR/SmtB family transcription factor n=1 Tax=Biformimicrobium ophioploci TaxID=3036711 RepID=A0ABQ6M0E6_9GAMM|nr:metalloregulator ArsR/SmtB family transcription factor [Microbulbifer sp. NKW57]GMG87784.1 metalloregulator ArsR/SmtB family transcription factor [Microbulbifer sp. NKW57]